MENKKEQAVVLGATANITFAPANVLIGIKKHSPDLEADFIIFHKNISQKDMDLINSIVPCQFIDYDFPIYDISKFNETAISKYTKLAYSRYECFSMLKDYRKVLWIDIDTLVQKDISELLNVDCKNGIAMFKDVIPLKNTFTDKITNLNLEYDLVINSFNTGVILFQDNLPHYEELAEWNYKKTYELSEYIFLADQGIINLALQEYGIRATELDEKFNCHPNKKIVKDAVVLHTYSKEKFWNFYQNKEWDENYKRWIKMGGSPYIGKRANWLQRKQKFLELYLAIVPNPIRQPKKFVLFVIDEIKNIRRKNV